MCVFVHVRVCVCGQRLPCFWERGRRGSMSLTSPSGAPLPRHTARLCFSVSVHFLKAAALQALSVPETLTSKLFFFVSQSTPPPKKQSKTWLPYISSSQRNIQFFTVGSSHFPPPSCRVSFLAGTASRTHTHAHLDTHTLSHTEGSFIPPPTWRHNCRLCGVLSARGLHRSGRCVCPCVSARPCHQRRWKCVRGRMCRGWCGVHVSGAAYGRRVGWVLLCTPGVKWTV